MNRLMLVGSVKNTDLAHVVEGSSKETCWLCDQDVWISPSSQAMDRSDILLICEDCLPKIEKKKHNGFAEFTDDQVDEMRRHCGDKIQCPSCKKVSHNINDIVNRYCGNCKKFWGKR